jgi:hypothetical protein
MKFFELNRRSWTTRGCRAGMAASAALSQANNPVLVTTINTEHSLTQLHIITHISFDKKTPNVQPQNVASS